MNDKFIGLKAFVFITATNIGRRVFLQYKEDIRNGKKITSSYRSQTSAWMYECLMEDSAVCDAYQQARREEGFPEFWESIACSILEWAYEAPSKYYMMLTAKD